MRLFEKCINTNDLELGKKLISQKAAFKTPVSPDPLYGAEGYLSVVSMMRASFPDIQWKLMDMVADENTVAVHWTCSGTFTGSQPFVGIQPNGRKFSTTVMNFYKFDNNGLIIDDIAGVGIAGILKGIGTAP
ncbi:MAG: ester cyclase [Kiritimatiellae bacterium]|nr:ester cyclase [Kiritimatiellia bacterium]